MKWQILKYEIHKFSIQYSKTRKEQKIQTEYRVGGTAKNVGTKTTF